MCGKGRKEQVRGENDFDLLLWALEWRRKLDLLWWSDFTLGHSWPVQAWR